MAINRILLPTGQLSDVELLTAYAPHAGRESLRVNFVTSIDGAVHLSGYSEGLSGRADKAVFGILRRYADAVLVGAGTVRWERYHALRMSPEHSQWRVSQGLAEHPTLVIVSASLDLDPDQSALAEAPARPIVLTHAGAPPDRRQALEKVADVVSCGDVGADLTTGLAELRRRGLAQILCEGGPMLFGGLVKDDLVDEVCLTIAPLLAGPGASRIIAGPITPLPRNLRPIQIIESDGFLLTRYARPE